MDKLDSIYLKSNGRLEASCNSCSCCLSPFVLLDFSFDKDMLLCPFCLGSDIHISFNLALEGGSSA